MGTVFNFIIAFSVNANSKEYLIAFKIYMPRLIGVLQMKYDHVPYGIMVPISDSLTDDFNTDFKIMSSLSSGLYKQKGEVVHALHFAPYVPINKDNKDQ